MIGFFLFFGTFYNAVVDDAQPLTIDAVNNLVNIYEEKKGEYYSLLNDDGKDDFQKAFNVGVQGIFLISLIAVQIIANFCISVFNWGMSLNWSINFCLFMMILFCCYPILSVGGLPIPWETINKFVKKWFKHFKKQVYGDEKQSNQNV